MTPLSPVAGPNSGFSGAPFMNGPFTGGEGAVNHRPGSAAIWTPITSPFAQRRVTSVQPGSLSPASSISWQAGIHTLRK